MKIYQYLHLHIKLICQRFRIVTRFTFSDKRIRDVKDVCLQTYRIIEYVKSSLLFPKNTNFSGN